jgi:nitric-oxide synthase
VTVHEPAPSTSTRGQQRDQDTRWRQAAAWLDEFGASTAQIEAAHKQFLRTGGVTLTGDMLSAGVAAAWRNFPRCIGRQFWKGLQVHDAQHATTRAAVAEQLGNYLPWATRAGRILPGAALVLPVDPATGQPLVRIWNEQLVRYAGYVQPDGSIVGDRHNANLTTMITDWFGWTPPGGIQGPFDVLPLVIEDQDGVELFELEPADVLEVEIRHPRYRWFKHLMPPAPMPDVAGPRWWRSAVEVVRRLRHRGTPARWHALPAISEMLLDLAGNLYPVVFSGVFVLHEVVRDLGDDDRYGLVPAIARRLGLDTSDPSGVWRVQATAVLAEAIWYSFRRAGVTIMADHTAAASHLRFEQSEERAGRQVSADPDWIVPPVCAHQMATWRRSYSELDGLLPTFVR